MGAFNRTGCAEMLYFNRPARYASLTIIAKCSGQRLRMARTLTDSTRQPNCSAASLYVTHGCSINAGVRRQG